MASDRKPAGLPAGTATREVPAPRIGNALLDAPILPTLLRLTLPNLAAMLVIAAADPFPPSVTNTTAYRRAMKAIAAGRSVTIVSAAALRRTGFDPRPFHPPDAG